MSVSATQGGHNNSLRRRLQAYIRICAIMSKHDVVHEPEVCKLKYCIASEEDRATTTVNVYRKFCE